VPKKNRDNLGSKKLKKTRGLHWYLEVASVFQLPKVV
jgi:hypothetical protein